MARIGPPSRISRRASGQQVYEDLHAKIVQGRLRPGEALSETKVAESYGLSRTPVREAFWRLGDEGFLRVAPQVGTFVSPINVAAVRDSQFVRETLECRAVADAARLAKPEDVERLRGLLAKQTGAIDGRDFATFFTLDDAMHRALLEMAGRPFVWQAIAGAKAQLDRVRFLSLEDRGWPGMILAQHDTIITRVSTRDAEGAVAIMTEHLRTAFAAIGRIAAEHEDFFEGGDAVHHLD